MSLSTTFYRKPSDADLTISPKSLRPYDRSSLNLEQQKSSAAFFRIALLVFLPRAKKDVPKIACSYHTRSDRLPAHWCQACGRGFLAQIGLFSHLRAH